MALAALNGGLNAGGGLNVTGWQLATSDDSRPP
jgi:hypothetical protein